MEQRERAEMQRRHQKLLSSKMIFQAFSKVYWMNMIDNFKEIEKTVKDQGNLEKAVRHFKVVLMKNRRFKLKRAYYLWYKQGLRPLQTITQSSQATQVIMKREELTHFYF
jgi:hypothetical protein